MEEVPAEGVKGEILLPVGVEGSNRILLRVADISPGGVGTNPGRADVELPIASKTPSVDQVLQSVTAFAEGVVANFREIGAAKVSIEFGCEFAVESGTLLAVIGKVNSKSALKVGLEWESQGQ